MPLIFTSPLTCNFESGFVIPIPTLPWLSIIILSTAAPAPLDVPKDKPPWSSYNPRGLVQSINAVVFVDIFLL